VQEKYDFSEPNDLNQGFRKAGASLRRLGSEVLTATMMMPPKPVLPYVALRFIVYPSVSACPSALSVAGSVFLSICSCIAVVCVRPADFNRYTHVLCFLPVARRACHHGPSHLAHGRPRENSTLHIRRRHRRPVPPPPQPPSRATSPCF
jgi:hypothetical protein